MTKRIIALVLVFLPVLLFSQEKPAGKAAAEKKAKNTGNAVIVPVQAQYSNRFKLKPVYFNRRIDVTGRGEILEIEIVLENLTDDPMDLHVFTIASYEKRQKTGLSFDRPVPVKQRIRSFVPHPFDMENFKYPVKDKDGNVKKDFFGKEIVEYKKAPHDPLKGVDQATGKPYHLGDKQLIIRTYHLSKYRKNYVFFNEAAVLVFDTEGKPVFRQFFRLNGWRR